MKTKKQFTAALTRGLGCLLFVAASLGSIAGPPGIARGASSDKEALITSPPLACTIVAPCEKALYHTPQAIPTANAAVTSHCVGIPIALATTFGVDTSPPLGGVQVATLGLGLGFDCGVNASVAISPDQPVSV